MADRRGRVQKILDEKLTPKERQLASLMTMENRKDKIVFRMPNGLISLEHLWLHIKEILDEAKIPCDKAAQFATLADLDDVLSEVAWLWKPWIPLGFVTLLAGDPGVGKSALALDIAKMVTNGLPFPLAGLDKRKPNTVVWIEAEASQQILRVRAMNMGVDRKRIFIPSIDGDMLAQPDVLNEDHQKVIMEIITGNNPLLVVLDSLGGSHTRGENRIEDIRPIMEFFAVTARDTGAAVLILHHLRKSSPGESPEISLYKVRGSTVIPAMARSIIALEKPTDDVARIRIIKSNLARAPEPIGVVFDSTKDGDDIGGLSYTEYRSPPQKRTKAQNCADWIMSQLNEHDEDGMLLKELCDLGEGEGYTRGNIYSARDLLSDRIVVGGTGKEAHWAINDAKQTQSEIAEAYNKNGTT